MILRLYDPKNIPKLIEFGRRFHALTALAAIPFDARRSEQLLRQSFMSRDAAVWAAFHDKKVTGLLIGALFDWPYLEGRYASDIVFAAERDGLRLYRSFEQWARSHGANAIQMGVSSGLPQAGEFYEKMGLTNVGGVYFQHIKRAAAQERAA